MDAKAMGRPLVATHEVMEMSSSSSLSGVNWGKTERKRSRGQHGGTNRKNVFSSMQLFSYKRIKSICFQLKLQMTICRSFIMFGVDNLNI